MFFKNNNFLVKNIIIIVTIILSGCKYNIYINDNIQIENCHPLINLYSYDPYGFMTMTIKKKLQIRNITHINCNKNHNQCTHTFHISLYIIKTLEKCITKSLFQDGTSAEHQLILTTIIKIKTQENIYYPFNITVSKLFFNNPVTVLANSIKENTIRKKIYEEISEEIINKLLYFINNNN